MPTRSSNPSRCVVDKGVPWTEKFKLPSNTDTSCRLESGMDDCVATVTAAVAAYRRCKQRIINNNQLAFVLGLLDEEDAI